jgi:hypothetical protein
MGWGHGRNNYGEEVGYLVPAICAKKGCGKQIDKGLAYCCGGLDSAAFGGNEGCGRYFCEDHLYYVHGARHCLCEKCASEFPEVCVDCGKKLSEEELKAWEADDCFEDPRCDACYAKKEVAY